MNSDHLNSKGQVQVTESGLFFNFAKPPAAKAAVVVHVRNCGEESTLSSTVDTDMVHGDPMLHFQICSLDDLRVLSVSVEINAGKITVSQPEAGHHYSFPDIGRPTTL